MVALIFLIFTLSMLAFFLVAGIYWILKVVEVVRIPDTQFRAAGSEKLTWGLVVVIAGWGVGGLIWQVSQTRKRVLAAAGTSPSSAPTSNAAPAGWYADPEAPGQTRWWDGATWAPSSQPA